MEKLENRKAPDEDRKGGRPEILTEELGARICKLIETMPDHEIEVNWDNVVTEIERKFKIKFGRRVLSQKDWGKGKVIAQAFDAAKDVHRRMKADGGKRHATTSRQNLLKRVETLEARLEVAKKEVEDMRAIQYDKLDRLRVTDLDLRMVVEELGGKT